MQEYKVISFDLDDTLIDDTQARKYGIEQVARNLNTFESKKSYKPL